MNDRFSAQLRQHLLDSADERPAPGQAAAIVDAVARTPQRPVAVLRLGSLPATARFGLLAAALAGLVLGGTLLAGGGPAPVPPTPFEGTWVSVDPGDGSTQTLTVGPGATPGVRFIDDFASGGACANAEVKVFVADGTGTVAGDLLEVSWPNGGGCSGVPAIAMDPGGYDYDEATDSIIDGSGLQWFRAGGGDRPSVVPTDAGLGSPFTSNGHGYTVRVPTGWAVRAASQDWTGEALGWESPAADQFFDPNLRDLVFLSVASMPLGTDPDAWQAGVLSEVCGDDTGSPWTRSIGADRGTGWDCGADTRALLVRTETRGYAIVLTVASPTLRGTYDAAWLDAILATMELRPEDAKPIVPTTGCVRFDAPGTYTAPVGSALLSVSVFPSVDRAWSGEREYFDLRAARCLFGSSLTFGASVVGSVAADVCHWSSTSTPPADAAAAAAALAAQAGTDAGTVEALTVDGNPAARVRITGTVVDREACDDGRLASWRTPAEDGVAADPGATMTVVLIDFNGEVYAVYATVDTGGDPVDEAYPGWIEGVLGSISLMSR